MAEFASPESANYVRLLNESSPLFPQKGIIIEFLEQYPRIETQKMIHSQYPIPQSNFNQNFQPGSTGLIGTSYTDYSKVSPQISPITQQFGQIAYYPADLSYQQFPSSNHSQFLDYYNYQLGLFSRITNAK